MNNLSRLFTFLVLAQTCAVAAVLGWRIVRKPPPGGAPVKAAYADINGGLKTALNMFSNDCGRYPTTAEGFQLLITNFTKIPLAGWRGPYVDPRNVQDPWGHDYVYHCPGIHNTNGYDLYSTGPDGISKNGGNDADDINNWDPRSPRGGNFAAFDPFIKIRSILLIIPLSCGACSIATKISSRAREFFFRNRDGHIIWLLTSVMVLVMYLSILAPKVAER